MKFTKTTLKRTIRTFIQAFVSTAAVYIPTVDWYATDIGRSILIIVLIPSFSAAIAAVMNLEPGDEML